MNGSANTNGEGAGLPAFVLSVWILLWTVAFVLSPCVAFWRPQAFGILVGAGRALYAFGLVFFVLLCVMNALRGASRKEE
ncbi:MAG: hypothetical protein ACUVRS_09550 [Armatimonadota bacterium]